MKGAESEILLRQHPGVKRKKIVSATLITSFGPMRRHALGPAARKKQREKFLFPQGSTAGKNLSTHGDGRLDDSFPSLSTSAFSCNTF